MDIGIRICLWGLGCGIVIKLGRGVRSTQNVKVVGDIVMVKVVEVIVIVEDIVMLIVEGIVMIRVMIRVERIVARKVMVGIKM